MKEVLAMRAGQPIPGFAAKMAAVNKQFVGLDDAAATKLAGEMMFNTRAAGSKVLAPVNEVLGGHPAAASPLSDILPGHAVQPSIREILTGSKLNYGSPKQYLNPLNVRGVMGNAESAFLPAQWSRGFGELTDDVTRSTGFLDYLKQGYSPEAAAIETAKIHPDWTKMSDFERNWMRRILPFYSWTRHVVPQVASNIGRLPGGLTAQAIRLGDVGRQTTGFLPPYLGGGLAIPVGDEDPSGVRRYLTRVDLPFETPLEMLSFGPGAGQRMMMKVLGQTNPLFKGPLEYASNRQFYTGRELDDLYSPTGYTALDQLLQNSPLANVARHIRTLKDPRKWADPSALVTNLLTGVRQSDVDVAAQRLRYGPQAVRELLKGNPNVRTFEDIGVKNENLRNLTPQELTLLRLYKSLERDASAQARAKKAQTQTR
jgi:hypothetical protein